MARPGRDERGGEETKKMTTMRRWEEEVVSLSLRGHGYGDEDDDRPEKPRRYGVTEMRSPIYSFRPTHDALQEILGSLGPFVDGLKFSGGSHSLMGKELVREITDLAHKHDIYVSTGDWAEHLLRQGPSTFKQYVEECRALGFDTIELNAGSLKLPEEALLRLVHLIKNSGLQAKPLFSVKFDSSDIPASGDRAFGAYMAPVKHSSERVEDVDLLIRRAERCLVAGADMVMIDADGVCQCADSLRADIIAKIVGRLGLEKTMFEASNANTSEWFVRKYGPRVNLFVDHSEVMNLERLRGFNMRRSNPSLLASPFFQIIQHRRRVKETWCKSKMGTTGGGSPDKESAPVCVTGATGYVGSWLVRTLLRRGYRVHATARDPDKAWQVLSTVEGKERLKTFRADMGEEGSFDEAVRGCVALFHVAASMELHVSPDQHNVEEHVRSYVLEPAMRGTINVLQSCVRAGTIRRVVFTSSISTMTATGADGRQKAVVDESCLRALDDVWGTKPIGWIYILSKRLTEEAAFRFAREEGIHLVSVVIPTIAGPFLTPSVPTSIQLLLSPITGDPKLYSLLVSVHARFGSIPFAHIQDVCDAHVFLMETAQAEGRYLSARGSYPMAQIAQLLSSHYPPFKPAESQATQLKLSKDFDASNSSVVSSKRLMDLGFKFEHDVRDIVKDSVAQCVDHGFLDDPNNRSN